jgi:hypothetical protein
MSILYINVLKKILYIHAYYDLNLRWLIIKLFFLKREQKLCPNLLIKKKRIAQLIYGKPGKNQYKLTTMNYFENKKPHAHEQTT